MSCLYHRQYMHTLWGCSDVNVLCIMKYVLVNGFSTCSLFMVVSMCIHCNSFRSLVPFKCIYFSFELAHTQRKKEPLHIHVGLLNLVGDMISWLGIYAYIHLYCVLSACKSLAKLAKTTTTELHVT